MNQIQALEILIKSIRSQNETIQKLQKYEEELGATTDPLCDLLTSIAGLPGGMCYNGCYDCGHRDADSCYNEDWVLNSLLPHDDEPKMHESELAKELIKGGKALKKTHRHLNWNNPLVIPSEDSNCNDCRFNQGHTCMKDGTFLENIDMCDEWEKKDPFDDDDTIIGHR